MNTSIPEKLLAKTVIANGEGIVRICGEGISIIHFCGDDEQLTLADCHKFAVEQGYDEENDMALVVIAEHPTNGAVYKHGNRLSKDKKWIWEKVGETCGYA